ncbi:MAG TPA: methyltransferase domain-containing protein [Thermodesulfobacteriota bacterium]|nr:class I SAM-dependent methyltransferase [Deltaproteobacteria bacterium]HNU70968.1 methyltransferase domain-containing protein [Thermodesulfobacteriota bacterium]HOC38991.1 methyltransferase domain-containing protein [Thermodesulfobacteriota bacterium]
MATPPPESHDHHFEPEPAKLLLDHLALFTRGPLPGPVLDLAAGTCRNGIALGRFKVRVVCCDVSSEALAIGEERARQEGVVIETWQIDLEQAEKNPFPREKFGGILVFRYLHRPLIPWIKEALSPGGILIYETYTEDQAVFGRPTNPAFLLKPGELYDWFAEWNMIHYSEGVREAPLRAVAQLVCRKPGVH